MRIASPNRKPIEVADTPKFTVLRLVESKRTATQKTLADEKEDTISDPMRDYCRELAFRYHGDLSRVAEELEVPMGWVLSVASKYSLTEGCPRPTKIEDEEISD
jgi:hypothetical protein